MKKKFSWKAFISFGLFFSFLVIFISGIILYFAPAGRIANWNNWRFIWLLKSQWQGLHTIFAFAFAILSIFHLFVINWKSFWAYLKRRATEGLNRKIEFAISSILFVLFFIGIITGLPPFESIMDFGEDLKNSWEKVDETPPVPHAEKLSLSELAIIMDTVSVEQMVHRLENQNIKFDNPEQKLEVIAERNMISPMEVYDIITKTGDYKPHSGPGYGMMSLYKISEVTGKELDEVLNILKENKINAKPEQTLREIADQYDMKPHDILTMIRGY